MLTTKYLNNDQYGIKKARGKEERWSWGKYAVAVNSEFVWRAEHNAGLQEKRQFSCP